jgi:hypothetical protein
VAVVVRSALRTAAWLLTCEKTKDSGSDKNMNEKRQTNRRLIVCDFILLTC